METTTVKPELTYEINDRLVQDLINLESGLFAPLKGFMSAQDYKGVVDSCRLADGSVWTIPVTLDVDEETFHQAQNVEVLHLTSQGKIIGLINVEDFYVTHPDKDIPAVFKTNDSAHPGVKMEQDRFPFRIGGAVELLDKSLGEAALRPENTRAHFKKMGWKTIVGFQTRNPVHRAHEHLQRFGMDLCDGVFINPLVGWKKKGDFSEDAVMNGYRAMLETYYTKDRVYLDALRTQMRYAGPREAVFHALIRRNLGCTHFIIGRDHAGVGDYYGKYEAHALAARFRDELGITVLLCNEPYFCLKCNHIVTDKHCAHTGDDVLRISGTGIRSMLSAGKRPDDRFMRPEVADALIKLGDDMFIK